MHPVLFQFGSLAIPSYGALAALGILLALGLAQITSVRVGIQPRHAWNLLVLATFASLALSRLVLVAMNLTALRQHPAWLTAISMVHSPLLAAIGIAGAGAAIVGYSFWARLPLLAIADCLAAPVSLAMAAEQLGALLAGSDFGRESAARSGFRAIVYSSEAAARWSGTPLGVPLYPVQTYAAAGALVLAAIVFGALRLSRRSGDGTGIWLIGAGVLLFLTENFRDWEGRGELAGGIADTPQLVGLGMVVLGGLLLLDWRRGTEVWRKVPDGGNDA